MVGCGSGVVGSGCVGSLPSEPPVSVGVGVGVGRVWSSSCVASSLVLEDKEGSVASSDVEGAVPTGGSVVMVELPSPPIVSGVSEVEVAVIAVLVWPLLVTEAVDAVVEPL